MRGGLASTQSVETGGKHQIPRKLIEIALPLHDTKVWHRV